MTYFTTNTGQRFVDADGSHFKVKLEDVLEVVEGVEQIPENAKDAVKDFIETNFNELVENVKDLSDYEISSFVIEQFPEFIGYVEVAFQNFL
ncbi:MAG: hypothetical protein V7782_00385 [Psychromonas sp.]